LIAVSLSYLALIPIIGKQFVSFDTNCCDNKGGRPVTGSTGVAQRIRITGSIKALEKEKKKIF